jgi:hypothetical protein
MVEAINQELSLKPQVAENTLKFPGKCFVVGPQGLDSMVDLVGIEPTTSSIPWKD